MSEGSLEAHNPEAPREAQKIVDSALVSARFQAHSSFERFAKFYGENLGAELGARARKEMPGGQS